MAGVFPVNGFPAVLTINGAYDVETVEGCDPLYYRPNCIPQFDPIATNALISEFVNAVNEVYEYDCSRLDNLALTLRYIRNLCNLPQATEAELTDDDTFAGCFSGVSKRIRWEYMKKQVKLDLCELVTATTIADNDSFAGCFAGESKRVTYTRLRDRILDFCQWTAETDPVGTDSVVGCFGGARRRLTLTTLKNYILDFCDWVPYGTVRGTDTLVGCINGARRAVTVDLLKEYILNLCGLPRVLPDDVVDTDSLAGCFGGDEGRIRIGDLRKLFGAQLYLRTDLTDKLADPGWNVPVSGTLDVTGKSVFMIQIIGSGIFRFGNITFNVPDNDDRNSVARGGHYTCIKVGSWWYMISGWGRVKRVENSDMIAWQGSRASGGTNPVDAAGAYIYNATQVA